MPTLSGKIDRRHGATVFIKVMQSPEYVEALKGAGLPFASPVAVMGILDTGANCSCLDSKIVAQMALQQRDSVEIHTPSTGPDVVFRNQFDASLVVGEGESVPLGVTVPVIECEFASQGFLALIGRDVLRHCVLTYDGPANTFTLSW